MIEIVINIPEETYEALMINQYCGSKSDLESIIVNSTPLPEQEDILDKIVTELEDAGAYEQEINGKTEFVEGITYCLNIINKYRTEGDNNERKTKV